MGEEDGLPEELEEPCTSFHNSLGELEQCLRLLLNSRLEDTLENVWRVQDLLYKECHTFLVGSFRTSISFATEHIHTEFIVLE